MYISMRRRLVIAGEFLRSIFTFILIHAGLYLCKLLLYAFICLPLYLLLFFLLPDLRLGWTIGFCLLVLLIFCLRRAWAGFDI